MSSDVDRVHSIMKDYSGDMRYITWRYASSLRKLLLPILHRWGVGMCRHPLGNKLYFGGTLIYPHGNLTLKPEAPTDCVDGVYQVHLSRERRSLDAIEWLYPDLSRALWTEVMVPIYSDDRTQVVDKSTRLLDYIEDIPLPTGKEYEWIVQEPGTDDVISGATLLNAGTEGWDPDPIPQSTVWYGPVTKEYLEDVCGKGYDYMHTLPRYSYGWENKS